MPAAGAGEDFWVFGYGSLMWRPGFRFLARRPARLFGAHRALCVFSHIHRGSPGRPGLVLGLDRGGSCRGVAFHVAADEVADVLAYLREREQVTHVYRETRRPIRLDGRAAAVPALCYVVDRTHLQYAGVLTLDEELKLVRQGSGQSGVNVDYVRNTVHHLRELGICDRRLEALSALLRE
jgi:cation transport protein ChaC